MPPAIASTNAMSAAVVPKTFNPSTLLSKTPTAAITIPSQTQRPPSTGGSVSMCLKSRLTPFIHFA